MKKFFYICFVFCFISSCATYSLSPADWTFEKNALVFHFHYEKNYAEKESDYPHINLKIFQLRNSKEFNELRKNKKGIEKLINYKKNSYSIASVKKIKIPAGSDISYKIDRLAQVKSIGIVVDCNSDENIENLSSYYEIPVLIKNNSENIKKLTPAKFNTHINLNSHGIIKDEKLNLVE